MARKPADAARVVFVGKRRPALEAARQLGLDVLLYSERAPSRSELPLVRHHEPLAEGESPDLDGAARRLAERGPIDAVLALTEGTVPVAAGLRRLLGVPGMGVETAALCSDKLLMKQAIAAAGLPCARFVAAEEGLDRAALLERLGLPLVIKPRIGWGSRGASVLREASRVPERIPEGQLAEAFIRGEEMSQEALVSEGRPIYTNPTEYLEPGWANLVPRRTAASERRGLQELLERTLSTLGIRRGFVHLELFLTKRGPVFGEIAARPPGGHIMALIRLAYGFDPWQAWLRLELGERPRVPTEARRFAGVRLLYPGAGRVKRVEGVEAARAVPGVIEASVRVKPGAILPPRIGIGQEAGRLIATAGDRASVVEALEAARGLLRIEVSAPVPEG